MSNNYQSFIPPGMLERTIHSKQTIIAYYEELQKMASDQLDIEFIRAAHLDETAHLDSFINLYINLFGSQPSLVSPVFVPIGSFIEGVKNSIESEIRLYDHYSNIFFTDTNNLVRKTFFQALADESKHAAKFNFIYIKSLERKMF